MYRSIKKIHRKPEAERKRLALGYAIVLTALLAILWGAATVQSFRSDDQIKQATNDRPLFVVVKDSFNNSINYALQKTSASATLSDNENILEQELKNQLPTNRSNDQDQNHNLPFLPANNSYQFLP